MKKIGRYLKKHFLVPLCLFLARHDWVYLILCAVITLVIVGFYVSKGRAPSSAFDPTTFSSVLLESGLLILVDQMRKLARNRVEDPNKLTTNYGSLLNRYKKEKYRMVSSINSGKYALIPVVLCSWLFDKKIEITEDGNDYIVPDVISAHYEELFQAHDTSEIYNNINIRIDSWDEINKHGDVFHMTTGRTSYYASMVTNRDMDYKISNGITVREILECGPFLHSLDKSRLSNHLGFNGFVESSDGQVMFVHRKKNVSIAKNTYADSIGASLKSKYALDNEGVFTSKGLYKGIIKEIEDELGIEADNLVENPYSGVSYGDDDRICLVAAYRDLLEGGKPQLLFCAKSRYSKDEINDIFKEKNLHLKKQVKKENDKTSASVEKMRTDGNSLEWIPVSDLYTCEVCPDKVIYNDKCLKMVPSASASLAMYIRFLQMVNKEEKPDFIVRERFVHGKYDKHYYSDYEKIYDKCGPDGRCEDMIFCGKRFVAVADGVTPKTKKKIEGKTPGRFAVESIYREFARIDNEPEFKESGYQIIKILNDRLRMDWQNSPDYDAKDEDVPRASVIFYDSEHKEIVNYGDCRYRIGDTVEKNIKAIDEINASVRAKVLNEEIKKGKSVNELLKKDPGRERIMKSLREQTIHENKKRQDDEYAYPVLNGGQLNEQLMSPPVSVKDHSIIILCTDGYPEVCDNLEDSEKMLSKILEKDPLMIEPEHMSTKGFDKRRESSFDDRAWISIEV